MSGESVRVELPPVSAAATGSMIAGILGALGGFCLCGIPCLLAIGLGHMALRETRTGKVRGQGMAQAGLILGYLFAVPGVMVAVSFLASASG